jgi:diguanylate cyclase
MNSTPLPDAVMSPTWAAHLQKTPGPICDVVAHIVGRECTALTNSFYATLMNDPESAEFVNPQSLEHHLKPGLKRWLVALFSCSQLDDLTSVIALQRQIGDVHARSDIPIHLIARGFHVIKTALYDHLINTDLGRDSLVQAVLYVDELADMALDEMSAAYMRTHEKNARIDEVFRTVVAGHNMALERERQLGALAEWENRLLRAVAMHASTEPLTALQSSQFGLWLHHKASLMFEHSAELDRMDDLLVQVDTALAARPLAAAAEQVLSQGHETGRQMLKTILSALEELRYLTNAVFDRTLDMEVGRDVLTQLLNRRFLPTILRKEVELARKKQTQFCVLMIDVDHFKRVNDQFGHEAGDRVLQHVAALLANQVRASDFVFRYGGEEFLAVLAEVDVDRALKVAEKIRNKIEMADIPLAGESQTRVTVSIGVAAHIGNPDYQHLLNRADTALYAAKHAGRNCTREAADDYVLS